ncbi:MAG TPA: hypothetical protein VI298_09240 [Geobacteraceae bacterium]
MRTAVLKPIEVRLVSLIVLIALMAVAVAAEGASSRKRKGGAPRPAAASGKGAGRAESAPVREWGPYLDVAYELTYWEKGEIREWREKSEKELGEPLADYIASWSAKLADPAVGGNTLPEENRQPAYRERDYLRLAIAQTVDYLQSDSPESLNSAGQLLEKLKGKATMPEVAFWTGFVKALQALENHDAPQFVARVYDIWNNSVMYAEQGALAGPAARTASGKSVPFLYRNIVNLVVNRAIIDRKLSDVNALGPLFLMLKERDLEETAGEGKYLTTLVQRIAEDFAAPDSDRYRLNFTVAVIEARRLHRSAAAKLDSEGMSARTQQLFERSRLYYDYALAWASSRRSSGAASAIADYLDLSSFAIQRLADNQQAPAYRYFAALPGSDGSAAIRKAMDTFGELAASAAGDGKEAGYANRELYLKAMHRLWRAIMELSLWTGDFYLAQLNTATDQQGIFSVAAPLQSVLNAYLDFLAVRTGSGFPDVVPASACFGGAEAAEKLAYAYQKTYAYSTDSAGYNLWFLRRLQAAELYPLDPQGIAQTASILSRDGRYNLFLDYFLPLADRFKQSAAVKKWVAEEKSGSAALVRDYAASMDALLAALPGGGNGGQARHAGAQSAAALRQLREELQRKPDHPVHRLLKAFYVEEMGKTTPYTLLMNDANRLNPGL